MTNKKSTKRALLMSALSLLMCVSMLIGSTFAWFTDTATTGVNTIQAGTLDVALEMSEDGGETWTNAEGQSLAWVDSDGNTLWEPGCTYTLPMLRVRNNGDLKLKYTIAITGINGDAKLNEAIEWTGLPSADTATLNPQATSDSFTIKGHMKEDAGNEYQGLSIEGIAITVYATQVEGEFDSFTNNYDQSAPLPGAVIDSTFYATLQEAIDAAAAIEGGATVKLGEDVVLTETITIPAGATVGLDLNGHSISQTKEQTTAYSMIINRGTLIIDDSVGSGVISYTDTSDGTHYKVSNTIQNLGTLTINGGTIKNMSDATNAENGYPHVIDTNSGSGNTSVTINGGKLYCANYSAIRMFCNSATYTNTVVINDGEIYGRVDFQNPNAGSNKGSLTINGGTFDSNDSHAWSMFVFGASTTDGTGMELSIKGGTFLKPIQVNYEGYNIGAGFNYGFITGGTFSVDPSDYVATDYEVKALDGTSYAVVPKDTQSQTPTFTVSTASQLQAAMQPTSSDENLIINITADMELAAGETWTPLNLDSYTGVSRIVINGNGHTIKGLNDSLLGTVIFGNTQVEINNLTLENSTVNGTGDYTGAFVAYVDSAISVTLSNCHLNSSTVVGAKDVGGLIGLCSSPLTIENCSVTGCTITGNGSVGSLVGLLSASSVQGPATISKVTVTGNTLVSNKAGTYRIGELIGTSNKPTVSLSDITANTNTCTQSESTGVESECTATKWVGRKTDASTITGDTSAPVN